MRAGEARCGAQQKGGRVGRQFREPSVERGVNADDGGEREQSLNRGLNAWSFFLFLSSVFPVSVCSVKFLSSVPAVDQRLSRVISALSFALVALQLEAMNRRGEGHCNKTT